MICAAWVGMGAGLLPRRLRGRAEVAMLVAYAVVASYLYGMLMNLSFWPFSLGGRTGLSFVPGDGVLDNLHRFAVFSLSTSLGWDLVRGITNVVLILGFGPMVLATLRRAARKAAFR